MPLVGVIRDYRRSDLGPDVVAGITTAVMLIPQSMGYALLAGLPPIVGLYAATVPILAYALFGTSRHIAVGPVALDSLLIAAGVGAIATVGTADFIALTVSLTAMIGAIQLLLGLFRVGFVVNFLSQPVLAGFMSAGALIIAASQLGPILGIAVPRSSSVFVELYDAALRVGEIHGPTIAIGGGAIAIQVALKRWAPRWPRALVVVVLGSVAVWALGLAESVDIVGAIPAGLPSPALPSFELEHLRALLPLAFTLALVGFTEVIASGKVLARQAGYDVEANRELIGIGAANLSASLFRGYVVAAGLSRSAVHAEAGARTQLAGVVTAAVIALALLLLTPLFYFMPKAVLAAIIMVAVAGLVDVSAFFRLWRIKRTDLVMMSLTFLGTLVLGIQEGILIGVVASIGNVVIRTTRPHVAVLGRLPGTDTYRNVDRFPDAETIPGVLALRLDAQLYFGNVNYLRDLLGALEDQMDEPLRALVIDCSGMNQLDASGEMALRDIWGDCQARGIELFLANVIGPVRDVLARSGLRDEIGADHMPHELSEAMDRVRAAYGVSETR